MDTKNKKKLNYKKLRLTDDYQYLSEKEEQEETKTDMNEISKYIAEEETDINEKLLKKHFNYQEPSDMLNHLYETNDINNNNKLLSVISSGLKDLKKEIKKMPKEERETKKPDNIVKIVEEILKFNKQYQEGQGIKILTPNQMLSRLPISLAQLQAGNNSEKLKNEIRQLLYSLYRSKNMTKQVYNNLMKPVWINNTIIAHKIFIVIVVTSQMLSRLSISLAQLEAGNNSEELKNEIRQLLYSLYRSKKYNQAGIQ